MNQSLESAHEAFPRPPHRTLDKLRPWALCVPVLALAIVLVYSVYDHLSSDEDLTEILGLWDHWQQSVPFHFYNDYCIQHGELPLWNPLFFCGTPEAAHPVWHPFYPPHLLRSLLSFHPTPLKTHVGLVIVIGLHVLMAGIGAFFFARKHGLSYGASFVAAFGFIFSATFARRLCSDWYMTSATWLPVLLLLIKGGLDSDSFRKKLPYGIGAGVLFGFAALAGPPQIIYYMSVLIACYAALYRLFHWRPADAPPNRRLPRTCFSDGFFLALLFLLAVLVAAVVLVPAVEFAGFSSRAMKPPSSPTNPTWPWLANLLVTYTGNVRGGQDFRLAGLGITLLALAAVTFPRKRDVAVFAALTCLLFDASLGARFPFGRLVMAWAPYQLGPPSRIIILTCFPLAMLAAFGVDAVTIPMRPPWRNAARSLLLIAAGGWAVHMLYDTLTKDFYLKMSLWAVALPAVTLTVMAVAGWLKRPAVCRIVLSALILSEVAVWNHEFYAYLLKTRGYHIYKKPLEYLKQHPDFWPDNLRETDPYPNLALLTLRGFMNGYDPLYIGRSHRVLQSPKSDRSYTKLMTPKEVTVDNQRGYLFLKRAFWLARQYVDAPLPGKEDLFPAATTVFLQEAADLPVPRIDANSVPRRGVSPNVQTTRLGNAEELAALSKSASPTKGFAKAAVVHFPTVSLPPRHSVLFLHYKGTCKGLVRSFFRKGAPQTQVEGKSFRLQLTKDRESVLQIPLPDCENLRISVRTDLDAHAAEFAFTKAYILSDLDDEGRFITGLTRRANSVEVTVNNLPGFRILTYLDAHYPGWKAYIDDDPVPIYLANDAFKAVVVPPGTHRVRFVFRPWRVYAGAAVSAATVLACGLVLLFSRPRKPTASIKIQGQTTNLNAVSRRAELTEPSP